MPNTRETRAIAHIPCPRCHAPVGEPCRTHHRDGKARMVPMHGPACCRERRAANQEMTTHKTLDAARIAAKSDREIRSIVEIDHATEGRCYIGVRSTMAALDVALTHKPMAQIKRLVSEHATRTAEEIKTAREQALRDHTKCERCNAKIDGNTTYSQQERYMGAKVTAWYCESCQRLLSISAWANSTDSRNVPVPVEAANRTQRRITKPCEALDLRQSATWLHPPYTFACKIHRPNSARSAWFARLKLSRFRTVWRTGKS